MAEQTNEGFLSQVFRSFKIWTVPPAVSQDRGVVTPDQELRSVFISGFRLLYQQVVFCKIFVTIIFFGYETVGVIAHESAALLSEENFADGLLYIYYNGWFFGNDQRGIKIISGISEYVQIFAKKAGYSLGESIPVSDIHQILICA